MHCSGSGPHIVIVNSQAGTAQNLDYWQSMANFQDDWTWIFLEETEDLSAQLSRHQACQHRLLAIGGDGTLNAVIQHRLDCPHHCEFAVIPTGSGNDFARSLAMPLRPTAAWAVAVLAPAHPIDCLECSWPEGRRLAMNMVTVGNTGAYLRDLTPELKQRWGPFCYLRGVIDVAVNLQTFKADVEIDGQDEGTVEFLNLFIANGRTSGGGLVVAPRARLDDNRVDVVIIQDGNPPDIAGLVGQFALGDFHEHPLVRHSTARHVRIRGHEDLPCTVDGESFTARELEVTVWHDSISMVAPVLGPNPRGSEAGERRVRPK